VAVNLSELCGDLAAETDDLVGLLSPMDEDGWNRATPAPGWTIRDQVVHLAFFDQVSERAATEPDAFRAERDRALADVDGMVHSVTAAYRRLGGSETLDWLQRARAGFMDAVGRLDPASRVPWYGPDMTVASMVTARLMETWAHGQDVADAVGVRRVPTNRLRHVAFIGARALPNSYRARGLPVPAEPVRVELVGPAGDRWVYGPEGAADVVRGPALDFCLVVTQRRHPADTDLSTVGPVAAEWLSIAQAFAGPPGEGRRPGQFGGQR
jgi:uncharacterized protein (TIGR03084 family)